MKKDLWVIGIILITVGMLSSCSVWEPDLGKDLLPPGDNVFLFHDTIFDIHAYPVSGNPVVSSEVSYDASTLFLLGNMEDTIVGKSEASLFTQFDIGVFQHGPNTVIDSMLLHLYISEYVGNTHGTFHIKVHEATERTYMDSLYFSDHPTEGNYNPAVLGETEFTPGEDDTVAIVIQDQAFIQKFLDVQTDTALFQNDSLFKDYFNGLYITATSQAEGGAIARVGLSNPVSRLTIRYANDSTEVDSTAGMDFTWATFPIEENYAQKINAFAHDHSNTTLSGFINNDSSASPFCYVQGMSGVNTMFSFTELDEWLEGGKVAINSAQLIFEVVPEEISGIPIEELPSRLMLYSELEGGQLEYIYDFQAVRDVDPTMFGGDKKTYSKGMFQDTTYIYQFNVSLHFQSMVDGTKTDNNFRLRVNSGVRNPEICKLWSNLYTNPRRIRLEVVYLKL